MGAALHRPCIIVIGAKAVTEIPLVRRRRGAEEWVLPYIVERKTAEDLRASIQVGYFVIRTEATAEIPLRFYMSSSVLIVRQLVAVTEIPLRFGPCHLRF